MALTIAGRDDEAMAAAEDLPHTAEATGNPYALSLALMAYGFAWRNADPDRALEGNATGPGGCPRQRKPLQRNTRMANLAQLEVERGDPLSALDHISLAIRHMHESGNMRLSVRP